MKLANFIAIKKQTSFFIFLLMALLPSACVSTDKRISSGHEGDRFEERIDLLADELLANQRTFSNGSPAAVMPGSLKSGRQYSRLEELIMDRLTLKLRQGHEIYDLSTQNWFEYREGRPLTFPKKSLAERDALRDLTIYEVSLAPEESLGKIRAQIIAQKIDGRTVPGLVADMEFSFKPASPAHTLYQTQPNRMLFPEGLEERPYTSLDRMAFSLAADLSDAYKAGIKVNGQQAADSEVQVLLFAKPGSGIAPEMARKIQEAIQQAVISSPGFTCVLSREDFGPAFGQIDFYQKNRPMFEMETAKFKAGTVLLMADISRQRDFGTAGVALRAVWRVSPLESETGGLIPTNVSGTYLSGFTAKAYLQADNRDYPAARYQNYVPGGRGKAPSYNELPGRGFE